MTSQISEDVADLWYGGNKAGDVTKQPLQQTIFRIKLSNEKCSADSISPKQGSSSLREAYSTWSPSTATPTRDGSSPGRRNMSSDCSGDELQQLQHSNAKTMRCDELAATARLQYASMVKTGIQDVNIAHVLQQILGRRTLDACDRSLPSIGSVLHDEGICKPCVFANKNNKNCRNGEACLFCHCDHKEKRRRSKRSKTLPVCPAGADGGIPSDKSGLLLRSYTPEQSTPIANTDRHVLGVPNASWKPAGWRENVAHTLPPRGVTFEHEQMPSSKLQELDRNLLTFDGKLADAAFNPEAPPGLSANIPSHGIDSNGRSVSICESLNRTKQVKPCWSTSWSYFAPSDGGHGAPIDTNHLRDTSAPQLTDRHSHIWWRDNPSPLYPYAATKSAGRSASDVAVNPTEFFTSKPNSDQFCRKASRFSSLPPQNNTSTNSPHAFNESNVSPFANDTNMAKILNFLNDSPARQQSPSPLAQKEEFQATAPPIGTSPPKKPTGFAPMDLPWTQHRASEGPSYPLFLNQQTVPDHEHPVSDLPSHGSFLNRPQDIRGLESALKAIELSENRAPNPLGFTAAPTFPSTRFPEMVENSSCAQDTSHAARPSLHVSPYPHYVGDMSPLVSGQSRPLVQATSVANMEPRMPKSTGPEETALGGYHHHHPPMPVPAAFRLDDIQSLYCNTNHVLETGVSSALSCEESSSPKVTVSLSHLNELIARLRVQPAASVS